MNKSFLKWAGSKLQLVEPIKELVNNNGLFIEPFAGSGVISLNVDNKCVLNDINTDLINLYGVINNKCEKFIEDLLPLFKNGNDSDFFYDIRNKFNETEDAYKKSLYFVYLNRHCFNGLCRYNKNKNFNVPFGKYKKVNIPEEQIRNFAKKRFILFNSNYMDIIEKYYSDENNIIYCDPPYTPLSSSSNFTSYWDNFNFDEQIKLVELCEKSKCKIIISNSYCKENMDIYKNFNIRKVNVIRKISNKKESRGTVEEILATNF